VEDGDPIPLDYRTSVRHLERLPLEGKLTQPRSRLRTVIYAGLMLTVLAYLISQALGFH
jgi:hypothetical protein